MKQQMNNQTKQEKTQQSNGNDQLHEFMNDKLQFEFEPPTHILIETLRKLVTNASGTGLYKHSF